MLIVAGATGKLQLVTGSAGSIKVHASVVRNTGGTITVPPPVNVAITTAATTDIVGSPGASVQDTANQCTVFNDHASVSNTVTLQHTDGTVAVPICKAILLPGEWVTFDEEGRPSHFDADGVLKGAVRTSAYNASTVAQGPGFAADTYAAGSFIALPAAPKVGSRYRVVLDVSKTAAGTATPIITVRVGTAGSTADAARHTFTFNAGTAAADVGRFEIDLVFRSVGGGTSAVCQARAVCNHSLSTTGLINIPAQVLQSTSAGFDSTVAGLGIGVSVNGGASAAWTVQLVNALYNQT